MTFLLTCNSNEQSGNYIQIARTLRDNEQNSTQKLLDLKKDLLGFIRLEKYNYVQQVLKSLSYEHLHHRHDEVPSAAQRTFDWIFSDASPFAEWLKTGNDVFWMSGKAGSGKSTLMKFIHHDERTLDALYDWAGSNSLKIAHHYFWYAGTRLQKSQEGLLRSLLYDILNQFEDEEAYVVATAFRSHPSVRAKTTWSLEELRKALLALESFTDAKVAMLIDGLDEYHPQDEHPKLVALLSKLAELPNVKLCVSSRPWRIFEKQYGNNTNRVRLEDLTRHDMITYTRDGLLEAEEAYGFHDDFRLQTNEATNLIESVATKAEGVFLWVYLVVRLLKEEIAAGRRLNRIQNCVDEFPSDLFSFFKEMVFGRIQWRKRADTAKALTLGFALASNDGEAVSGDVYKSARHSFLTYWLLSQDDGYDKLDSLIHHETKRVSGRDLLGMRNETIAFLEQVCRDLLRVVHRYSTDDGKNREPPSWKVYRPAC